MNNNNNNNNKQICIAPEGRNFRGAGARQRVSEQKKKRKPEAKRNVFSLDLKTATESLLRTVFGSEITWEMTSSGRSSFTGRLHQQSLPLLANSDLRWSTDALVHTAPNSHCHQPLPLWWGRYFLITKLQAITMHSTITMTTHTHTHTPI